MKVLVLGHAQTKELLTIAECVDVMDTLFRSLEKGDAVMPLRQSVWQPDRKGLLGMMPAYLGNPQVIGGKFITVFSGNRTTKFESHQGAVLLFECEHGQLLAVVDATTITGTRTAAASGAATRALARGDAEILAILGSGVQASAHLAAMRAVRPIAQVRVWSRNHAHARRFAEAEGSHGVPVAAYESADEAVSGADIICTTTAATEPVLEGRWVPPGAHVNAVGASIPGFRELDSEAVAMGSLFTDRRESLRNEADDYLMPLKEGRITEGHLRGEIGEVLTGKIPGRTSDSEITIFKSLGIAAEDLASAYHVYVKAKERKVGTWIEFSGERKTGET